MPFHSIGMILHFKIPFCCPIYQLFLEKKNFEVFCEIISNEINLIFLSGGATRKPSFVPCRIVLTSHLT